MPGPGNRRSRDEIYQLPPGVPVRKWIVIAVFVGTPLVMLTTVAAWVAIEVWRFQNRPAAVLHSNSEKIRSGMRLEEVQALLGNLGEKIAESPLPEIVDGDVPVDSPGRIKPVVSGEHFYKWEADGGAYFIVSLKHGVVHRTFFYEPSL
jgi:hypothetical protein